MAVASEQHVPVAKHVLSQQHVSTHVQLLPAHEPTLYVPGTLSMAPSLTKAVVPTIWCTVVSDVFAVRAQFNT